jgi:bifunctional UDP-N-acetylglucosamine pyrophosphorylase/glucosamine-1-phosphate N-acetyltransferase
MAIAIAILAAGKGTRLKSRRPKVLHSIGGKPLLLHVIDAALGIVPATDIYVIVGHEAEKVRAAVAHTGVRFAEQGEQKGTGHAVQQALASLHSYEHVLVLSGDVPLLKSSTVAALRDFHISEQAAMTILSAEVENPFGYGRVIRQSPDSPESTNPVQRIVEQKSLAPDEEPHREINSGIYAFALEPLAAHIGALEANNSQGELYLTDMAGLLAKAGERVLAMRVPSAVEVLGANTIAEMMALDTALRQATAERHMVAGITIFQPHTVVIDAEVEIGPDTVLEPFVQLLGATTVGAGSTVRSYSVLENMRVGDRVLIRQGCILADSEIRDGALIGPYAHVRPESLVEEGAHIGNFVELKKTHMGKGAKANHLAYLGDTEIGAEANIGAGTIVCNFDGVAKHRTRIGEGAFIGSDSVLVAPLTVGAGAYVAAASCVTEDVPDNALALGRARQVNKEGWATTRRARASRRGKRQ